MKKFRIDVFCQNRTVFFCAINKIRNSHEKKNFQFRLSLLGRVKLFVAGWADAYANLFSLYLGEKVSTGHVMRITHAVVAFYGAGLFLIAAIPLLSMLFLIWFVLTFIGL